ncbi:hypothetical protein [Paenibacillus sp. FSL R7-0652]|uniref:hypothetical protein n=1 Tax=Paenibacillus sp. FSL R7-0652 TaxID=2921687 RepID=UPI00315A6487
MWGDNVGNELIHGLGLISKGLGVIILLKTEEGIAEVINHWDPLALLAGGAPRNEYDLEIKEISKQVTSDINESELARVIYSVFKDKTGVELNPLSCLKHAFQMLEGNCRNSEGQF